MPASARRDVVEQRILEEAGRLPTGGVVSGWAGLRLHGVAYLDGLGTDGRTVLPVDLVVPPGGAMRRVDGIAVHRERLERAETAACHGVPTASGLRATFDAVRWARDLRSAVAVLDLALASQTIVRRAFDEYMRSKVGWPGVRQVKQAWALSEPRTLSPRETALRLIWTLDGGYPRPRCNWPVADARRRFLGRPDLLSEELGVVGEFDGAVHRSRSQHREDLRRDDRFREVGLETFRVVGADLHDVPLVLTRIRTAIDRSQHLGVARTWLIQANPGPV